MRAFGRQPEAERGGIPLATRVTRSDRQQDLPARSCGCLHSRDRSPRADAAAVLVRVRPSHSREVGRASRRPPLVVNRGTSHVARLTWLSLSRRRPSNRSVDLPDGAEVIGEVRDAGDDAVQLQRSHGRGAQVSSQMRASRASAAATRASPRRLRSRASSSSSWPWTRIRRPRPIDSRATGRSVRDRRGPRWCRPMGGTAEAEVAVNPSSERRRPESEPFSM